jgi:hypothetical protein
MDPNSQANPTDATPQDAAPQDAAPQSEPETASNERTDTPQASDSWHRQLRLDLRGHEGLAGLTSASELAERYIDLSSKAVTVPGEEATEEDWAAYHAKMGVPESPDGYQLEPTETVPEQYVKDFAARAQKANLTPQQARDLYQANIEAHRAVLEEQNQAVEQAEKTLRDEWGEGYDDNVQAAVKAARKLGGDALAKSLVELPAHMSVDVLRKRRHCALSFCALPRSTPVFRN